MLSEIITLFSNKISQLVTGLSTLGVNNNGQIGDGTTINRSSPVQISSSSWNKVASGYNYMIGIRNDYTLWSWGINLVGQLGNSTTSSRSSPTQVGTLSNWNDIALGAAGNSGFALAVTTAGTLYAWGANVDGNLGNNAVSGFGVPNASPIQIGSLTNWRKVFASQSGNNASGSFSIKTDGTLWAWGANSRGNLGDGTTINRSSPVQIGTDTNWYTLGCPDLATLGIKIDGSLFSWGQGALLGLNNASLAISSPVQVGSSYDWVQLFSCPFSVWAKKTDGTLWAWGSNNNGQLGTNTAVSYSSPVLVGSGYSYVLPLDNNTVVFVKNDGTLWGVGAAGVYGLFSGTISSPVQIGSGYVAGRIPTISMGSTGTIALLRAS